MKASTVFKHGQILTPEGLQSLDLEIDRGIIINMSDDLSDPDEIDVSGKLIVPGIIDVHNHGAAGFDFSYGKYLIQEDIFISDIYAFHAGLQEALQHYLAHGITRILLTTMAAPLEQICQQLNFLNQFLETYPQYQKLIAGVNIEGTFLVDPHYAGAQNPEYFYALTTEHLTSLIEAGRGLIKIINIPPEHGEALSGFAPRLADAGITISAGHTAAYGDEVASAVDAGLKLGVHFLNGPARSSSKSFRKGGAEEMMLKSDDIYLEIIADGYHVDPSYARDIMARKGYDRVIVVTDSMFVNGVSGVESFTLFGLQGAVSESGEYLQNLGQEDCLFGSVLNSDRAFSNVMHWLQNELPGTWHRLHPAHSWEESLVLASKMCSGNPAKLMDWFTGGSNKIGTGSLEIGKSADLIVGHFEEGLFKVEQTWINGIQMFDVNHELILLRQ